MDALAGFSMGAFFALFIMGDRTNSWPQAIVAIAATLPLLYMLAKETIEQFTEDADRPYDWERDGL